MCLKPRCAAFWHLRDAEEVPTSLNYSAPFLRPVKLETNHALEDLRPPLPVLMDASAKDQITTSRHFSKGWHCQKCGRLSSRFGSSVHEVHGPTLISLQMEMGALGMPKLRSKLAQCCKVSILTTTVVRSTHIPFQVVCGLPTNSSVLLKANSTRTWSTSNPVCPWITVKTAH